MPPLDGAEYLVDYLMEVGPTMAGNGGSGPLTFQELQAWQSQVGIELEPWEVKILRSLSLDYLNESREAEDPYRPPPYGVLKRSARLDKKLDSFLD